MNLSRLLVGLFTLVTLATAAAQDATTSPTPEQERIAERQRIEAEAARLPKLRADSIAQVIRFGRENGMLTVHSSLDPGDSEAQVLVDGLKGIIRLRWIGSADPLLAPEGRRSFQCLRQDLTDPSAGVVYVMIANAAERVQVSRDAESDQFLSSVQYVQDSPSMAVDPQREPFCRLYVSRRQVPTDERDVNLALSADSFSELLLKHRAEVDRYLRPIIREFEQEASAFAVPSEMAWQVLGGQGGRGDDALREQIDKVVAQFNAEDFRARRTAMDDLRKLGQPAALVLMKTDRTAMSPQQRVEIDRFLAEFVPLDPQQSQELAENKSFLLDVLYSDDPALRKLALDRLGKLTGQAVELDSTPEPQSRTRAIAALRDQLLPMTASTGVSGPQRN
jgi:hypothetical protein